MARRKRNFPHNPSLLQINLNIFIFPQMLITQKTQENVQQYQHMMPQKSSKAQNKFRKIPNQKRNHWKHDVCLATVTCPAGILWGLLDGTGVCLFIFHTTFVCFCLFYSCIRLSLAYRLRLIWSNPEPYLYETTGPTWDYAQSLCPNNCSGCLKLRSPDVPQWQRCNR